MNANPFYVAGESVGAVTRASRRSAVNVSSRRRQRPDIHSRLTTTVVTVARG